MIINFPAKKYATEGHSPGIGRAGYSPAMTATLVLIRHGQSVWNLENLFTGWWDADLTDQGVAEARAGGRALAEAGVAPDVLHT